MKIAFGQLSSESTDFTDRVVDREFVEKTGYLLHGADIADASTLFNEVRGALDEISKHGATTLGLVAMRANSGGPFDSHLHDALVRELVDRLTSNGPVGGVLLSLHGSMTTQVSDDPDGQLIERVRRAVGPAVPIAVSLDLHANITHRMVANADVITAYQNYPHTDTAETAARAAHLLLAAATGRLRPRTVAVRIPWVGSAFNAGTRGNGAFASLSLEARSRLSGSFADASLLHVGSYVDVQEFGSSVLVVGEGNAEEARQLATDLARRYWAIRESFKVETVSVADAVARSDAVPPGPILLLDTADTTGGGASGDSILAVRELGALGIVEPVLASVVDPLAAGACYAAGPGARVALALGHSLDPRWGEPLQVEATVVRAGTAEFTYQGGLLAGQQISMGRTALVEFGSMHLLISSTPVYEFADEHYRAMGIDVSKYRFVVVKNMMNFREALAPLAAGWFVLDCPGPTPADFRSLPFRRPRRPLEPFDDIDSIPAFHEMATGSSTECCPDPARLAGALN